MESNGQTPNFDKIIVYHNGKRLEIETDTLNQILYYIDNIKFELKDFSKFHTEKDILEYYYNKEKESIGYMDINFQKEKDFQEFFKNFTQEIIIEKYRNNQQIVKIKVNIESGLAKIVEEFKKNEKLELNNLPQKYYDVFKTNKIPNFINNQLIEDIQSIQLIKKLNQISYNQKLFKDSKNEILLNHFTKLLNGEEKPFEIGDRKNLFNIFLYSNLKDIYKNNKIKEIISGNYYEISKCFLNFWENISEFESEINNRKGIGYIDDKLLETFSKYELNDSHLYSLASYFYLIMVVIKDTDINNKTGIYYQNKNVNVNNPLMNKMLNNVLNCFCIYCPSEKYDFNEYINFINFFNNYIIVNGVGEKENKYYDFTYITTKIRQTNSSKINNDFDILKQKICLKDNFEIIPKLLIPIFRNEEFKNSLIKLIPLTKNRHSNTITILISGFLSQKGDINSWKNFFNYDRNNSNYYLFRWPSSDISTLIFKSLIFIFNAASLFIHCKNKAKFAGKMLACFLASNEEFNNCQINLVGFSLGCQVTKYCIKELAEIPGQRIMINNVLFLGGATVMREDKKSIWRNKFKKVVGGRVINCFSTYDWVLENLFKLCVRKNPIGLNKMNLKDENGEYDVVEDYDFSDLKLGHTEYRSQFEKILSRINFLNSS